MRRDKSRNFSWVYQDLITGDLVLVMKPRRRAIGDKYRVLAGVFRRAGFRPVQFITCNVTSFTPEEFRQRFQYEGGLNTGKHEYQVTATRRGFRPHVVRGFTSFAAAETYAKQYRIKYPTGDLGSRTRTVVEPI